MRDGYGRRNAVDPLGRWLIELIEKLAGVSRKAFNISPLALGIERVEGHAGFATAGDAAEYDQLPVGQVEIDLPQVVDGYTAQLDGTLAHDVGFLMTRPSLVGLVELDPPYEENGAASNPLS